MSTTPPTGQPVQLPNPDPTEDLLLSAKKCEDDAAHYEEFSRRLRERAARLRGIASREMNDPTPTGGTPAVSDQLAGPPSASRTSVDLQHRPPAASSAPVPSTGGLGDGDQVPERGSDW